MRRSYAPEFRHRVVQRVRSGHSVKKVAAEVGAAEATVFRWVAQDKVDRGERPGTPSRERTQLARAHRRIRELETELAIVKKASDFFNSMDKLRPKGNSR
jgi:transposase